MMDDMKRSDWQIWIDTGGTFTDCVALDGAGETHRAKVLSSSALLIVIGAAGLLLVEPVGGPVLAHHDQRGPASAQKGVWYGVSWPQRANQAVFQSITARTAGFNTIETARLSNAGKLWMCGLMLIGGSPASTAGGMKTVTIALLVLVAYNMLRRRNDVEVFRRSVSVELLKRAVALAVLYLGLVAAVTMGLCIAMRNHQQQFIDLLFEACSACGTVGLSTGVTSGLNFSGKCVTIVGMFIGRLGPLTLLLALASRIRHVKYEYPAETVVIG